jgi:hypothetical protein
MDPQSTATAPAVREGNETQRQDETRFVLDFVEQSARARNPYMPTWEEILNNYLVVPYGADDRSFYTASVAGSATHTLRRDRRARLKDPETHQIVETITSQAIDLLLGQREYIAAIPTATGSYDRARLIGNVLMAFFEQPGIWTTHYQLFKDAFLFGTAILEIGWESRARLQYVRGSKEPERVIYRDQPLHRPVDIWKFYPDPSGTSIQRDMIGCAKEFEITIQEARRLAEPSEDGEPGVYDKDDVEAAILAYRERCEDQRKRFPSISRQMPERFQTMKGLEYWGESPEKASDGMSNRVITLLNGVRVRSRGNVYWDGNIPFKEIVVNPIAGRFWGLSPAEVIRYLQDSADNMLMVLNDAADLAVRGPLLVGAAFGGNPDQLRDRMLGDIINCTDPKMVGTVPVDLNALQFAALDYMRRKQSMREATGATDTPQAIGGGGQGGVDKTATEASLLYQAASRRVIQMVLPIEKDAYPWIGKTTHSRMRQFIDADTIVATLGGQAQEIPFAEIDNDADVRFVGSRHAGSKFQKAVQNRQMAEVLGSDRGERLALLAPEVLVRWFRDGMEIPDAEAIVERMTDRALALKRLSIMSQGQGGPLGSVPTEQFEADETFGTLPGEAEQQGEAIQ